jgi:acyl-CoA dehydrogenase
VVSAGRGVTPPESRSYFASFDEMLAPANARGEIERDAWQVGVEAAGPAANDVDRQGRFPHESLAAMRAKGLLSAMIPVELGGRGASLASMSAAVRLLATHCASSALVLAMHQLEVGDLVRHGTTPALRSFLAEVAQRQLLLANAHSEVGIGGDAGRSICAIERSGGRFHVEKQTLAISYGEYADAILTTARSHADAHETDLVQVVCRAPHLALEPTSTWDTIGLRGTRSSSFRLEAEGDEAMVFSVPWSIFANRGYLQSAQILLSSVWFGLAEASAATAHRYVRELARRQIGTLPPAALRLAELATQLQQARNLLAGTTLRYEEVKDTEEVESPSFVVSLRGMKVSASELAVETATTALAICGMSGYRRDSSHTMDRLVRDSLGSLVMVSNDRYLYNNAQLLLAMKQI